MLTKIVKNEGNWKNLLKVLFKNGVFIEIPKPLKIENVKKGCSSTHRLGKAGFTFPRTLETLVALGVKALVTCIDAIVQL